MKKLLLLIGLCISLGYVSAQIYTYQPLNDTSLIWYTDNDIYPVHSHTHWQDSYHFTGADTIIGLGTYQIVYDSTGYAREHYILMDTNERYYLCHYPSDGNFLFSKDILLYDFNAMVGDTLYLSPTDTLYHNDTLYYYVQSIDTILVNNIFRKSLTITTNLDLLPWGNSSYQWIEGIGNAYFGLLSFFTHDIGFGFSFCGQAKSGVMIYPTYGTPLCNTTTGIGPVDPGHTSVYPVPASDHLFISYDVGAQPVSYKLYDVSGQQLLSSALSENNISLTNISPGIYILTITDGAGNMSLQKVVKE